VKLLKQNSTNKTTGDPETLAQPGSLFGTMPGRSWCIFVVLVLAALLLAVGVFAPMLTFRKFFIFSNQVSLFSGLLELFAEGYPVLFLMILSFSILLPLIKIVFILRVLFCGTGETARLKKYLEVIVQYGKWSMLDVFVAAVLIVSIRLGAIADVEVHYGLYLFAASVVLTMVASFLLSSLLSKISIDDR